MDIFGFMGNAVNIGVVFGILVVVQIIKKLISLKFNLPGIVYLILAFVIGAVAAMVIPQDCADAGWRCWVQSGIVYGGASSVAFSVIKDPFNWISDRMKK